MDKVIPKVGQTWTCDVIGGPVDRVIRKVIDNGEFHSDIFFECANHMNTHQLWQCGAFKPANDLEWLAVNVEEWCASHLNFLLTRKDDFAPGYWLQSKGECTHKQWKDKRNELFGITEELPVKPIYTQAMCDAGELPPAGSECDICFGKSTLRVRVVIIAITREHVILNNGSDNSPEHHYLLSNCRFINVDTRTEEEKLIDEKARELYSLLNIGVEYSFDELTGETQSRYKLIAGMIDVNPCNWGK